MTITSAASATPSGFQQLSLASARRNADQAAQMAESLRRQASAAQTLADKYEVKARSLDTQADQAQGQADDARLRLNLASSFRQTGQQLAEVMKNAVVKQPGYALVETRGSETANTNEQSLGANIDTTA